MTFKHKGFSMSAHFVVHKRKISIITEIVKSIDGVRPVDATFSGDIAAYVSHARWRQQFLFKTNDCTRTALDD